MRVRGMDVNFPRSCISPIITLKQPASARGLEKGEQSFSRPLLGAAAYLFILCEIHERSVLLPRPLFLPSGCSLFFGAKSTVRRRFFVCAAKSCLGATGSASSRGRYRGFTDGLRAGGAADLPGVWYFWIGFTGFRTTARWELVFLN